MKACTVCKVVKPFEDFVKRSNRHTGRQPYCKECHNKNTKENRNAFVMKDYDLKKAYGITMDQYNQMSTEQEGKCKICNVHISEINHKKKKHLCVDHCHKTKKVRGLLCDKCNRGLGLFSENTDRMKRAIEYLTDHLPK
jgi:hypothetical protein